MKNRKKRVVTVFLAVLTCLVLMAGLAMMGDVGQEKEPTEPDAGLSQQPATDPNESTTREETGPEITEPRTTEPETTELPAILATLPDIDGTYEQWLAAAMYALSFMEYPEHTLSGLYAASATSSSQKMDSQGVYMLLSDGTNEVLICSKPLSEKRSERGVTDLHTSQLGYATFDVTDPTSVNLTGMIELDPAELADMISYAGLPALYSN